MELDKIISKLDSVNTELKRGTYGNPSNIKDGMIEIQYAYLSKDDLDKIVTFIGKLMYNSENERIKSLNEEKKELEKQLKDYYGTTKTI